MQKHEIKWMGAVFLTLLSACSGIPFFSSQDDPIQRVGLEQQRKAVETEKLRSETIQKAFAQGEITLGMSMDEVIQLWGHPGLVDVTGDRRSLNQEWTYIQGLISPNDPAPTRMIYFEKGRVSGWKITE